MDMISTPEHKARADRRGEPRWLSHLAMVVVGVLLGATGIAVAADGTPGSTATPSSAAGAQPDSATDARDDDERDDEQKAKQDGRRWHKPDERGPGRNGGKHLLRGGAMGAAMGGALHGEFVVAVGDGRFQTLVMQRGEVTSASATSITLKSDDGFTRTYVVTEQTRVKARGGDLASIAKGSRAGVVARKDGDTLTAQMVRANGDRGRDRPKIKPTPSTAPTGTATSGTAT